MRETALVMRAARFNRRGAQCAPAGRRGRRPLRPNRKIPPSRRDGCPHPPPPQAYHHTRRGGYQPPVSNRVLFTVGPVWDRPLRRSSDWFLHFRRGGTPGRPETARWGHRALRKIKRTFGYAVGAGPRPARRSPEPHLSPTHSKGALSTDRKNTQRFLETQRQRS